MAYPSRFQEKAISDAILQEQAPVAPPVEPLALENVKKRTIAKAVKAATATVPGGSQPVPRKVYFSESIDMRKWALRGKPPAKKVKAVASKKAEAVSAKKGTSNNRKRINDDNNGEGSSKDVMP